MSGCEEEERDYGNSWQKYQGRRKAICFLWRKSSFHLSHPLLPLPFSVISPAFCRSPILVFMKIPKPISEPSDMNCHLQGTSIHSEMIPAVCVLSRILPPGLLPSQPNHWRLSLKGSGLLEGFRTYLRTQPGKRISYSTWWEEPREICTVCSYCCFTWSRT